MKFYQFTSTRGIPWVVRRVEIGRKYGASMTLVTNATLIEFYDARYDQTPCGQFVSRYLLETLQNKPHDGGLNLYGGVEEWQIGKHELMCVLEALA